MKCIENINKTPIPNDLYMTTLDIYYQMGKNDTYKEVFEKGSRVLTVKNAYEEALYFYKCFFSDLRIPESRLKTLQLDSTVAKNKAEHLYKNIIEIFQTMHHPDAQQFHLTVTEITDLVRLLFRDYYPTEKLGYQKLDKKSNTLFTNEITSKRELLEEMIHKVSDLRRQRQYEPIYLYLNFLVDFINMDLFKFEETDIVAILILYILMLQEGVYSFHYISFFNKVYLYKEDYIKALNRSRFGWSEGYSDMMPLSRFIFQMIKYTYDDFSEKARGYSYDQKLEISKEDYIENTIDKLPEVFSKEDIRERHPLISDSTINRTLKRMNEENKIRPTGKGRSAKWMKLYKKEKKGVIQQEQLDL